MKGSLTCLLHLFLALAVCACGPTDSGNPSANPSSKVAGSLHLRALPGAEVVVIPSPTPSTRVDEVWLSTGESRFVSLSSCGSASEAGPRVAPFPLGELSRGGEESVFDVSDEPSCRLALRLVPATAESLTAIKPSGLPTSAPAELEGHSLLVRGQTATGVPFTLLTQVAAEVSLRGPLEGFGISAESNNFVLALQLERLLGGIDLSTAQLSQGSILIDTAHNTVLLTSIESRLNNSFDLYQDDGDGILDAAELAPGPVATSQP